MLRAVFRLGGMAALAALVFLLADLCIGYVVIKVLHLHRPYPDGAELVVLTNALKTTVPLVFGLTLLGLLFVWSTAQQVLTRVMLRNSVLCGVANAVVFTLEDIPRQWGSWLALLLPAVIVGLAVVLTNASVARAGEAAPSSSRWRAP
jgi:hypothetical protein